MVIAEDILIYAYVQTSDTGFAPCYDNCIWTLVCCKPQIRSSVAKRLNSESEEKTIFIVGLSSRLKYKGHKPIYIARVDQTMKLSDYFIKYADRKDSVYMKVGTKWLSKVSNPHLSVCCIDERKNKDTYVEVDDSNGCCWHDLYYKDKDKIIENYALLSKENEFVHFNKTNDMNWSDNIAMNTIIEEVKRAPRSYHIFSTNRISATEFLQFFENAKKMHNELPVVPWDENESCRCCK